MGRFSRKFRYSRRSFFSFFLFFLASSALRLMACLHANFQSCERLLRSRAILDDQLQFFFSLSWNERLLLVTIALFWTIFPHTQNHLKWHKIPTHIASWTKYIIHLKKDTFTLVGNVGELFILWIIKHLWSSLWSFELNFLFFSLKADFFSYVDIYFFDQI